MNKSGRWIALAGVCVGAFVGLLLPSLSVAASQDKKAVCVHKKATTHKPAACAHRRARPHQKINPHKKAAAKRLPKATIGAGAVSGATWMHDLAPHLWSRKLSDIVIPGSHDSATYGLAPPDDDFWHAQDEDLAAQLDGGMRELDLRVEFTYGHNGFDYYAHHGSGLLDGVSKWLTLSRIFSDVEGWARAPGHGQEIIMLNLQISQLGGAAFPTADCKSFAQSMGSALITPSELQANLGTSDPGQVTLRRLWSLPDPAGAARVIMDNTQCLSAATPDAGQWGPFSPDGQSLYSGYYADQCSAGGFSPPDDQVSGITSEVLGALNGRLPGPGGGEPTPWDSPKVGGLYELYIQGTPEGDCLFTPHSMLPDERTVLAAVYDAWSTSADQARQNLNLISGDFVQDTDLFTDVIAMDQSLPVAPDAITPLGTERVERPQGTSSISASVFTALVSFQGKGIPGAAVTYQISPAKPGVGFGYDQRTTTLTVAADEQGDVKPVDLWFPDLAGITGTWTVTASAVGAPTQASWTVVIAPATGLRLTAARCDQYPSCNPRTVQVTKTYIEDESDPELSFTVAAVDKSGLAVAGVPVTFDAGSAGTFASGGNSVTVNSRDILFNNRAAAPAFTAGTRAGAFPISITSPQADNTLILPVTVTPGPPTSFVVTRGDGQAAPISTKFPIALKGHWVDQYGNVVTDPPSADRVLTLPPGDGTWPNGDGSVVATPDANGTITAPALTAGTGVLAGADVAHSLIVKVGPATGWTLQVMPGPPVGVTISSGDGQHAPAGKPFSQAMATKVTDAAGNPIPGAPVTFKVSSGEATSRRLTCA